MFGAIDWQPLPIAVLPQVGEEAGAILVKMQKRLPSNVEYPAPPLDEPGPRSEALQQVAQRIKSRRTRVFHHPSHTQLDSIAASVQGQELWPR